MKQLCLVARLNDDAASVADYARLHRVGTTPPEVIAALRASGIRAAHIHRHGDQLIMVLDVEDDFTMAGAAERNRGNPHVQAWNRVIAALLVQQDGSPLWTPTEPLFDLADHP